MVSAIRKRRLAQFLHTRTIAVAMMSAASVMAGGRSGDDLDKALRFLRNTLLPDLEDFENEQAASKEEILRREVDKGPIQIQALDYGKKKKRNR